MDNSVAIESLDPHEMDGYEKIDQYNPHTVAQIADKYRSILADLGEDPEREGLVKTPERVAKALQFLTHGYDLDPAAILRSSLCEPHMLPCFGKAHVAYIPNGFIVGLSKIPRVVDAFARRLQVQERLTVDVRNCIAETL